MIVINGIEFPEHTNATLLEPRTIYDYAIIGYDSARDIAIYSERLLLMSCCQFMTYFEALENYSYNVIGASKYHKNYPVFINEDGEEEWKK